MTVSQLEEWLAYNRLEPIGEWRGDHRIGVLCSYIDGIVKALYRKKGESPAKAISPMEIMKLMDWADDYSNVGKTDGKQSVEEMKAIMLSIASRQNKKAEKEEMIKKLPPPKTRKRKKKVG